jgi:hypothetical protein
MRSRGFNGFLTQRQGPLDFEVRYKSGIFGLAFRETDPLGVCEGAGGEGGR